MDRETRARWKNMEVELEALLGDLTKYEGKKLNKRPAPDQWSAMQTLHHVMRSERLSLHYLRKKLSDPDSLPAATLRSRFRSWLLHFGLAMPLKFKAPKAVSGENLPEESDLADIAAEWSDVRRELWEVLESLPSHLFTKEIYKHPLVGKLSLPDMIKFLESHFQRHRKQVYRALKAR